MKINERNRNHMAKSREDQSAEERREINERDRNRKAQSREEQSAEERREINERDRNRKAQSRKDKAKQLKLQEKDPEVSEWTRKVDAVKEALRQWWCDKPYHLTSTDEVNKMCAKNEVTPERQTRIIDAFLDVMGPDVGTCSCVKCGQFCSEPEGTYKLGPTELDDFRMTQDEYDALSSLERRFLHIVKVYTATAHAYYHVCERGLQNEINEIDDELKDINAARIFVCHERETVLSVCHHIYIYIYIYIYI